MKTAMDCYKIFEKLVDMRDIGHSWEHFHMTVEELNKRMNMFKKSKVSGFTVSDDEVFEQMLFLAEDNAEEIQHWLYYESSELKRKFTFDCEKSIGTVIFNKKWCDRNKGFSCSRLEVVLTRIEERDGDYSFKITTEYIDLTDEEKAAVKAKIKRA